jgi:DNA mismatch repair protein MutS
MKRAFLEIASSQNLSSIWLYLPKTSTLSSKEKKKTETNTDNVTPLMGQYIKMKAKYPDAILLFRVGDFYETFGEDAVKTSKALGIILTSRNNGGSDVELAGFPHHSLDMYLPRLVRSGYRVAICEQLEKPSPQKKIVNRGVTEVVTPGIAVDEKLLDHKSNNYLACLSFGKQENVGIALLDISTGEFLVSEGELNYIDKLIQSFQPSEIIFSKKKAKDFEFIFGNRYYTYTLDDWVFSLDYAKEKLLSHFEVSSLKGFGIHELELAQIAAGTILHYLATTENKNLRHISSVNRLVKDRYVWLDRFTIRNLELVHSPNEAGVPLIQVLDYTSSPMGARLLKKWVILPLTNRSEIEQRLEVVQFFNAHTELVNKSEAYIRQMGDIERLISRVPLGKINPREVIQLKKALEAVTPLKSLLEEAGNEVLLTMMDTLNPCKALQTSINKQVVDNPPVNLTKGGVIADGFHPELDDLRFTIKNTQSLLIEKQQKEARETGIDTLKIGYNSVFGYYLEVTNKYKDKGLVPDSWVRKQTLSNGERYITEELKKLETKILSAEERMLELEERIFSALIESMHEFIQPIQHNAMVIAKLDCLLSFSRVAIKNNYVKPEIDDSFEIDIRNGRHPVIETQLPPDENYVPNNVKLDQETQQIIVITGPNMSGKSALLRQTALICLMAQMGSFVPAQSARIGLIDKVFTRVGASDNLSAGESTFMVEMNETALIMNNLSERSLILLDEIGRGTSTYDGISIAWSIAEFLHNGSGFRPKTLFATHYHELNELANKFERIKNFNVAVREVGHKVIFLRKLVPGGSEHSFGIHVAKMAGMPRPVVDRAHEILKQLEEKSIGDIQSPEESVLHVNKAKTGTISPPPFQLSIFETFDPNIGKIKELLIDMDLNTMTPVQCLMQLNELKKLAENSIK